MYLYLLFIPVEKEETTRDNEKYNHCLSKNEKIVRHLSNTEPYEIW